MPSTILDLELIKALFDKKINHVKNVLKSMCSDVLLEVIVNYIEKEYIEVKYHGGMSFYASPYWTLNEFVSKTGSLIKQIKFYHYVNNNIYDYEMNQTFHLQNLENYVYFYLWIKQQGDIGEFESCDKPEYLDFTFLPQNIAPIYYQENFLSLITCKAICTEYGNNNKTLRTGLKKYFDHAILHKINKILPNWDTITFRKVSTLNQKMLFHFDHAVKTMQIVLNDDYTGGDLIFINSDNSRFIPKRYIGSMTMHDINHLHGVSPITSGIRMSLFFIQHHHV